MLLFPTVAAAAHRHRHRRRIRPLSRHMAGDEAAMESRHILEGAVQSRPADVSDTVLLSHVHARQHPLFARDSRRLMVPAHLAVARRQMHRRTDVPSPCGAIGFQ